MHCKYYCGECEEYYFRKYTDMNERHDKCGEFSSIVWGFSDSSKKAHDEESADGGIE